MKHDNCTHLHYILNMNILYSNLSRVHISVSWSSYHFLCIRVYVYIHDTEVGSRVHITAFCFIFFFWEFHVLIIFTAPQTLPQFITLFVTQQTFVTFFNLSWITCVFWDSSKKSSPSGLTEWVIKPQGSIYLCFPSTGIMTTCHDTSCFTWVLVIKFRSLCLQDKHFTNRA